jgi:hypothetical protein
LRTDGHGVIEAEECFRHIVGHANVNGTVGVVPVEVQTDVEVAGPVNGDGVLALKDFNEMASMLLSDVLYPKIINHEAEVNGPFVVREEAGSVGLLDVAIFLLVDNEVVVGKDTGLGEAVHAFVNFTIDKTIDREGCESLVLNYGGWDFLQSHAHVLWSCHWRVQIKVLYVKRHELGARCGYDTVEVQFGCLEVGTF